MAVSLTIAVIVSYLLGSVPAGYLIGRAAGVDIRQHGSGNIGATNVLRVLGKAYGYAVFAFDLLKGLVAVRITELIGSRFGVEHTEYVGIIAAAGAVVGHSFPIWLRFRGGKGVATAVGSMLGLMPVAAAAILVVWLVVFELSRYVSLASIVAALALPVVVALLLYAGITTRPALFYFSTAIAVLIIWRHRTNIARLRAGTEPRFERK